MSRNIPSILCAGWTRLSSDAGLSATFAFFSDFGFVLACFSIIEGGCTSSTWWPVTEKAAICVPYTCLKHKELILNSKVWNFLLTNYIIEFTPRIFLGLPPSVFLQIWNVIQCSQNAATLYQHLVFGLCKHLKEKKEEIKMCFVLCTETYSK